MVVFNENERRLALFSRCLEIAFAEAYEVFDLKTRMVYTWKNACFSLSLSDLGQGYG